MDWNPFQGGVCILLASRSCYRNGDKLLPDGPRGSYVDFTLTVSSLGVSGHLNESY